MPFLPQTSRLGLRIGVTALCVLYLIETVVFINLGLNGHWVFGGVGIFFWLPLSFGLWTLKNIARVVALVIHWFLFVMLPFGIMSPETAMNPTLAKIPLWALFSFTITLGAMNCLAIYILTKFKDQFQPLFHRSA